MSRAIKLGVRIGSNYVTRYVSNFTFRKEAVGGVSSINVQLAREVGNDTLAPKLYDRVFISDTRTAECIAEGRVADLGRSIETSGHSWSVTAFGPVAHAQDKNIGYHAIDKTLTYWVLSNTVNSSNGVVEIVEWAENSYGIKMSINEGTALTNAGYLTAGYRFPSTVGLFRVVTDWVGGETDVDWTLRAGYKASWDLIAGGVNMATATGINTTGGNLTAAPSASSPYAVLQFDRTTAGTAGAEEWVLFKNIALRSRLKDASGNNVTSGFASNTYVLAHEVVADLLGAGHLPLFDGPGAEIGTNTFQINQFTYPDGTTPFAILADLMLYEPAFRWYARPAELNRTQYKFSWEPWPTQVRYEASLEDGAFFPLTGQEVYNRVRVRWTDTVGTPRETIRTAAVTMLDSQGIVRQAEIDLGASTQLQAEAAGDNFLADHALPTNSGSITIRRPIGDRLLGSVQPWEIEPGELIRIRGIESYPNSLDSTDRDGASVFRIASMEYRSEGNEARLELDTPSRTTANALAQLVKGR